MTINTLLEVLGTDDEGDDEPVPLLSNPTILS